MHDKASQAGRVSGLCDGSGCGVEDEQRGLAVRAVRDGEAAAVGGGVHGNHVCCVGEVAAARDRGTPVVHVEGGQPAAFRGDVEPVGAAVVGQHVGVLP